MKRRRKPKAPDPNKVTFCAKVFWTPAVASRPAHRYAALDVSVAGIERLTLFREPDATDEGLVGWTTVPRVGIYHLTGYAAREALQNILGPLDFKRATSPTVLQEAA